MTCTPFWQLQFDPHCFTFIISFFHRARDDFYGTPDSTTPAPFTAQSALVDPSNPNPTEFTGSRNPILTKQAIIVLREELEYFAIPPSEARTNFTNEKGLANEVHIALKVQCGLKLLEKKSIFTALQRNVNKENNVAEQHLIDMLCMSGFNRDDEWGYRAMEPNRCCISSIALVLLKTGIIHGQNGEVTVDSQQMGTAQKLLLFWRKPAVSACFLSEAPIEFLLSFLLSGVYSASVGGMESKLKSLLRKVESIQRVV